MSGDTTPEDLASNETATEILSTNNLNFQLEFGQGGRWVLRKSNNGIKEPQSAIPLRGRMLVVVLSSTRYIFVLVFIFLLKNIFFVV